MREREPEREREGEKERELERKNERERERQRERESYKRESVAENREYDCCDRWRTVIQMMGCPPGESLARHVMRSSWWTAATSGCRSSPATATSSTTSR